MQRLIYHISKTVQTMLNSFHVCQVISPKLKQIKLPSEWIWFVWVGINKLHWFLSMHKSLAGIPVGGLISASYTVLMSPKTDKTCCYGCRSWLVPAALNEIGSLTSFFVFFSRSTAAIHLLVLRVFIKFCSLHACVRVKLCVFVNCNTYMNRFCRSFLSCCQRH